MSAISLDFHYEYISDDKDLSLNQSLIPGKEPKQEKSLHLGQSLLAGLLFGVAWLLEQSISQEGVGSVLLYIAGVLATSLFY